MAKGPNSFIRSGIKPDPAESPLYGAMLRYLEPFGSVGRL
jgi:hypothetical protein